MSQWARLLVYLDHGSMTPDNNRAENAIRPFVLGRKNWLLPAPPKVLRPVVILFSLIETAKANGLSLTNIFAISFEKIPCATSEDDYRALLPSQLKPADLDIGDRVNGCLIKRLL
ncbi:MAG: transposase [Desulfofustis sp. PB-SRB1]|nr:transposase [Desulfofustis sp. PB-SRB1]